jgi:uncharacterized damage-inducible protein DinB
MGNEKTEILEMLEDGEAALGSALEGISEADAGRRPGEGRWSVVECVEHMAASEAALLGRLREALPAAESHANPEREAKFAGLALNRERRIEAPDPVRPKGECAGLGAALERFRAVRAETLRFVEEFDGDLRSALAQHPLITRPVNCYEMLLLMALHPKRHAEQIAGIRAALRTD